MLSVNLIFLKIFLFLFKIHLLLLKVREYRVRHLLSERERGYSSLYSTMTEHPHLPGAWVSISHP